ncbi:hypothetical protein [Photobacterium swingsii]
MDGISHTENQRVLGVTGRHLQGKEAKQLNDRFRTMIRQSTDVKKPES